MHTHEKTILNTIINREHIALNRGKAMATFTDKLNFSSRKENDTAIRLYSHNRDLGYYYDNLCLYCANNDVDVNHNVSERVFDNAAEIMESFGTNDNSTDVYYFWID